MSASVRFEKRLPGDKVTQIKLRRIVEDLFTTQIALRAELTLKQPDSQFSQA